MSEAKSIYVEPEAITAAQHAGLSVDDRRDFDFARRSNSVPLTITEFSIAAREMPIVFVGGEGKFSPVALLGLRSDESLFIGEAGEWLGRYVPAVLRRYPFVFSHAEGDDTYTLCIDAASERVNDSGIGKNLFDENGEATTYLKRMGDFLRDWQKAYLGSLNFCKRLEELGLLRPSKFDVRLQSGKESSIRGFALIDRARLNALDADQIAQLQKSGDLELIYAHMLSLGCVRDLAERLPPDAELDLI